LQDALYSSGVIIEDSHNTGDSIFRAMQRARQGEVAGTVRVEHNRGAR
jgi:hypothetical protein